MNGEPCQSVILCEGYHDRSFWSGWLESLKVIDLRENTGQGDVIFDPWGDPVKGEGQFVFKSAGGPFLRVVPCHGKQNLSKGADRFLKRRETRKLVRLVVSRDLDRQVGEEEGYSTDDLLKVVQPHDANARVDSGDILLANGTLVSAVVWNAGDPDKPGLPKMQTLERLVCAAIVEAYPERAEPVQNWLDARPDQVQSSSPSPKEHSWSYMAGWFAENGCDDFFRAVWRDEMIADALKKRLEANGVWRIAEALAG